MKIKKLILKDVFIASPLLGGLLFLQSFLIYSLMTGSQFFTNSLVIADSALRVIFFAGAGIVFGSYTRRFTAKTILVSALCAGIFVLAVEWFLSELLVDVFLLKKNYFYLTTLVQAILICALVAANRSQSSELKNQEAASPADFFWLLCGAIASVLVGLALYVWYKKFNDMASRQTIQLVCSLLIFALPLLLSFSSIMQSRKSLTKHTKILNSGYYGNFGIVVLIVAAITLM